ncbi:glycerol-3-phosphate 1-O-acyltransferase PlsY [Hymenobacter sp. GOD-10R]|uniref:glycerol-3-phosphate 1-O-acyltransferase PlsY n=1 Tax=Hymenobacter sp. GOD-10R TaxID=3093922 RepID=UPI002D782955|nr:glycerol-3-phosphate 1-O-acyltransferase PlsY [Hymenobacter sp. GOD-10R]WRQ28154.1 glycerol-3-phosphate 1-O-acyltransferase PlsY [Hymenobacter sp. GOD-10R]
MNLPVVLGLLVLAYLLGSIPTALWVGQRFFGLDIREHGSGNAGATNTFRVLGKKPGSLVMAVDVLKGWAATSLAQVMLNQGAIREDQLLYFQLACGILAVLGHIYPIFAGFRGGKGVATVLGMMLAIAPLTVGVCLLVFLAMLFIWRYVSLSSMTAGLAFALLQLLPPFRPDNSLLLIFGFVLAGLLIYTHRANIQRLLAGTESRVPLFGRR